MYQFMFIDAGDAAAHRIAMTNGRKLDRYRYTVSPGVEIDTALGRMATLHLVKQHRPDESRAEIWLPRSIAICPSSWWYWRKTAHATSRFITKLEITNP